MVNARECCKCFTVSLVPVTVFCLAVVFLGGIIVLPTLFVELANYQQYGVVIDAGSSHTSFYLYEWYLLDPDNSTGVVFESSACPGDDLHYVNPKGISTFIYNTSQAGPSLRNCSRAIVESAPKDIKSNVTVFLGATAGMRLVNNWNRNISDEIMENVNNSLKGFLFGNEVHGRIISGKEEATSGWVTVNYLNGHFSQKYPNRRERSLPSTYGSLDMGGASMQIAFADTNPPENYSDTFTLFGSQYTLYSRSYLCYGYTEALRQISAKARHDQPSNVNVSFPCLPKDAVMNITEGDLFGENQYCTRGLNVSRNNLDVNVTFVGTGDGSQCRDLIQKVMDFSNNSVPLAAGNFTAFNAFYYTAYFYNISNLTKTSIDKFETTVNAVCNSTINEAKANARRDIKPEHVMYYCFSGQYVLHVLKNGFEFNSSTDKQWIVHIANSNPKIKTSNDKPVSYGWALGYMMLQSQDIPRTRSYKWTPYSVVDLVVGMLVLSILCFVFVVFFLFTCTACYRALKTNGYSNIA